MAEQSNCISVYPIHNTKNELNSYFQYHADVIKVQIANYVIDGIFSIAFCVI